MAEIVEVIHKINYEVNDAGLNRVTGIIRNHIVEINRLTAVLRNYQRQLSDTRDIAAFNTLSTSITRVSKQIEATIGQTKSSLAGLKDNIVKGLGLDLESSISNFLTPVKNALYGIDDQGKKTGVSIASIGSSLFSLSGALPLAISLVGALATQFFAEGEAAKKAREEHEAYIESLKNINKTSDRSTNAKLNELRTLQGRATVGGSLGIEAVRDLKEKYPGIFKTLSPDEIKNGKGFQQAQDEIKAVANIEKIGKFQLETQDKLKESEDALSGLKVTESELRNRLSQLNENTSDLDGNTESKIRSLTESIAAAVKEREAAEAVVSVLKSLLSKGDGLKLLYANAGKNILYPKTRDLKNKPAAQPKIVSDREVEAIVKRQTDIYIKQEKPVEDEPAKKAVPSPVTPNDPPTSHQKIELDTTSPKRRIPSKLEKAVFGETADIQDPEERRREEINKSIDAYKSLASSAVDAFNTIYDAQIKALDAEIKIRERRVEAATKLAERGNTEALKQEQARLDEAIKKREDFAKRQAVINAAMTVSNSILAIATAAGSSGPAAIVIVPAVIAALAAGFAAVSSLAQESSAQQFAEGGYTGHGGKYEAAGIVHKGEFVMNAVNTRRYRPLLEAMHGGMMPVLKQPDSINTQYASRKEMSGVEKKLDSLIDAVEATHTKVNARVDERGIAIITERYKKAERRRWS